MAKLALMCEAPLNPTLGPQPILTDGVVLLSHFRLEDAPVMVSWDRDPEMARRFDWPQAREMPPRAEHLSRCEAVIRGWWEDWAAAECFSFAIRERGGGPAVGACDLHRGDLGLKAAYNVLAEHRRKGYATTALGLLTDWAFRILGVDHVDAHVEDDNVASRRVAEKAGFIQLESFIGEAFERYGPMADHVPTMIRYRRSIPRATIPDGNG